MTAKVKALAYGLCISRTSLVVGTEMGFFSLLETFQFQNTFKPCFKRSHMVQESLKSDTRLKSYVEINGVSSATSLFKMSMGTMVIFGRQKSSKGME